MVTEMTDQHTREASSGWGRDTELSAQDLGGTTGWDAGVWGEVSTGDPLLDLPFLGFHHGLRECPWGSRDQITCPQAWVKASLPLNCCLGPYKASSLSAKKIDLFEKLPSSQANEEQQSRTPSHHPQVSPKVDGDSVLGDQSLPVVYFLPRCWGTPGVGQSHLMSQKLSPGPEDPRVQRSHPLGQKSLRMLMSAKSAR